MLKKLFQFLSQNKKGIIVFLLALFLRTIWLNRFPLGIAHDEINYLLNAKSIWLTGNFLPLTANALLSWGKTNFDVVISELPSLVIAPFVGTFNFNLFTARFIYALISSFSCLFLFFIVRKLLGEKIAFWAGVALAVNPWSVFFGRTAFEFNFSLFFYLWGMYLVLTQGGKRIFWALPLFVAGFFSYLGAKLVFLPLIAILLLYKYFNDKKDLKKCLIFGAASLVVFLSYYLTLPYQPAGTRKGELAILNWESLSGQVNTERLHAIQNPFLDVFSNKGISFFRNTANTYIGAFSTLYLFEKGEVRGAYSLWQHGTFYFIDFFLILLGLVYLFSLNKKAFWLIIAIILISPTVSAIDLVEVSYAIRSFLMFPFLASLVGIGLYFVVTKFPARRLSIFLLGSLYLLSIVNFLYLYFYRYSVYGSEGWFFSERILAKYLQTAVVYPKISTIYVVTYEPKIVFEEFLFYGNFYNKKTASQINQKLKEKKFEYEKIVFTDSCPKLQGKDVVIISEAKQGCFEKKSGDSAILSLTDAGQIYNISLDPICTNYTRSQYYQVGNFQDLEIEKMNEGLFCIKWIGKI